ncbi:lipid A phosphate methyltransferase [Pelagibius litoralis]|uniref:Lipid A phosphate methyltransferase n=1 Tax=Pelagibius litoralis TaxID=374515 RepID=A0A967F1A7_9PROT|nr:isoprenylcysteine carboxylmethyltransferase family protein [Pelagibius litoralis]NIA71240.1 lipid A phosphate methyltransferase [Pelagibius litoralis]
MAVLQDEMVRQGGLLFHWRSFIPLMLAPVALAAIWEFGVFDFWFGEAGEEAWVLFCFFLAVAGQTIRVHIVGHVPPGTSGRNTRLQRADELNTSGFYSICRHPLYLANFIVFAGILLAVQVWWFVLVGVLAFWVYYERIMAAEEAFLHQRFGQAFEDWAKATPAFIPVVSRWRSPERTLSWKTILRREPYGYFAIIAVFFVMEVMSDLVVEGDSLEQWLHTDFIWPTLFAVGAIVFVVLRTLKKTTRLFSITSPENDS